MRIAVTLALLISLAACGDASGTNMSEQERRDLEWTSEFQSMTPEAQGLTLQKIRMDLRHAVEQLQFDMRWWVVNGTPPEEARELTSVLLKIERDNARHLLDLLNRVRAQQDSARRECEGLGERTIREAMSVLNDPVPPGGVVHEDPATKGR